jgi:hypothetical protein
MTPIVFFAMREKTWTEFNSHIAQTSLMPKRIIDVEKLELNL